MQYRKILLTFYLIMLSAILPIYMKDGYYMLGEEKWNIYMIISAAIAGLIIFAYISEFIEKVWRNPRYEAFLKCSSV